MSKSIYILGYGRSGSTLLEGYLASQLNMVAIGELCYLFSRGIDLNPLCSCGSKTCECNFWCHIIERIRKEFSGLEIVELGELRERYESTQKLPYNFLIRSLGLRRVKLYKRALNILYRLLREQENFYIDSSKMPGRVLWIPSDQRNRIQFLFLYRDPRGVAYSNTKKRKILGLDHVEFMPTFSVARSYTSHFLNTLMCLFVVSVFRLKCKLVTYEKFVEAPSYLFRSELKANDSLKFGGECHSFSGNPSRFTCNPILQLDDKWKEKLSKSQKVIGHFVRLIEVTLIRQIFNEDIRENREI